MSEPVTGQGRKVQALTEQRDEARRRVSEVEEALAKANQRALELDGAVIELQGVLVESLARWHPRRPEVAKWRERLGPLWPQDAGQRVNAESGR